MKRTWVSSSFFLAVFAVVCFPAMAHHGSAGYDYSVPRKTLVGTVTDFVWQNPHSEIFLDVKDSSGKVTSWAMELNNPGNLIELGWSHTTVKAGDQVTVTFNPGKQGRRIGICVDLLLANGRKLHSSQGCVHGNQQFNEERELDK
jgi:hypothetical protein